jgi:hypothetical protein
MEQTINSQPTIIKDKRVYLTDQGDIKNDKHEI